MIQNSRGTGADHIYLDEGGTRLTARIIGDTLNSAFRVDNNLLISTMRLRGEVLKEEMLTVNDKPAITGMQAKGIQRVELRRQP